MIGSDIKNINILIVDDDDDCRETLVDVLIIEGYNNTIGAEDGHAAIEVAKNRQIDLVISDLQMPGMDGIETIRRIKSYQPDIISFILTGFGSMEVAIRAFSESQVDDFLPKPYENEELYQRIRLFVGKKMAAAESDDMSNMVRKDFSANRNFLGQFLVDNGYITDENLAAGLEKSKEIGQLLGLTLVDMKLLEEDDLTKAISDYKGYPVALERDFTNIPENCLAMVPMSYAKENHLIPLSIDETGVKVAMINPDDLQVTDTLKMMTKQPVSPLLSTRARIHKAIDEYYSKLENSSRANSVLNDIFNDDDLNISDVADKVVDGEEDADSAPIKRLVDTIIHKAVLEVASDIHIEPEENSTRIRFRKDGRLYVLPGFEKLNKKIHASLVARIKILSETMKIDVKMTPQDGKIRKMVAGRKVDFRVGSLPTQHGEKIVMRLLDQTQNNRGIEEIFDNNETYVKMFKKNIARKDGMVLVTGPTGSGKTQTLAAAINYIKGDHINILTAEDPVEITNPGIIQVEIDVKQGRTYQAVLKQFLRQDPDVIMIGEMRDYETSHIGCEAALTGHLVFSTLHTNDAPATITRFIEMGIKDYLIATVVHLVLAQRLGRTICKVCKKPFKYDIKELKALGMTDEQIGDGTFYKGEGCPNCKNTGQSGRVALIEILELTDNIRTAIINKASAQEIGVLGKKEGTYFTLQDDAIRKFIAGRIDLNEVLKYVFIKTLAEDLATDDIQI